MLRSLAEHYTPAPPRGGQTHNPPRIPPSARGRGRESIAGAVTGSASPPSARADAGHATTRLGRTAAQRIARHPLCAKANALKRASMLHGFGLRSEVGANMNEVCAGTNTIRERRNLNDRDHLPKSPFGPPEQ